LVEVLGGFLNPSICDVILKRHRKLKRHRIYGA
jgi:hypothetical protein